MSLVSPLPLKMTWSYQGPVRLGLLILLAVLHIDARECKINCHGSSGNLLRFEPGKVYTYKLEGESVTTATGATGDASKLGISADVQVSVLSSCEHALKVTNVHVTGQDGKKHGLDKLSLQPIKFGLQNGRIESELCATDAEDNAGLNIKRAVLSLIQSSVIKDNGFGTQTETDIFGSCPTGFEFSKSGSTVTIVKNRDLNKCAHREDITTPFLTTPYNIKTDHQSTPLLLSSSRSEQKVDGGILKSAYLEEQYQYSPGASVDAVSKVNVKTRLAFVSAAPGAIPATCTVPRSIIFEQEHPLEGHGISNKIVELVKQGCDSRIIGQDTAHKFSLLVRSVAFASKADINSALQSIKSGSGIKDKATAQKMLLDAIVMAQTGSSVEVMADILKKQEVTGNTARLWLLGLGAVKHATRTSLIAVLPLLDGEPDVNAYLGIGSLAGKFCQEHSCDGVNEVNQLQIKLGAPLLKGCKVGSKKEEDQVIASLKGLGNIKYLGPKIAGKIAECAQDVNVNTRIRVAALETIATDAHHDQFKTLALSLLKNTAEDSEIRIKAYLVLTKCPCGKVAAAVKDLLNTEQSNQVGGYIVSHLRSLHASTNPDKAAARHHLGNIIPPRRFIIDPRRYSINQELSYCNGIINSGASGEFDLIYSQNSFAPRSVSLNLTTQIFGTAYNFLEIDLRAENLELLAERIFGPKGYLHTNKPGDIVEDGRHEFSHVLEKIASRYDKTLRPKRSISREQLNNIAKKVHLPLSSDDIDLDLSVKVLGSVVSWTHLHGSDKLPDTDHLIDDYFGSVDKLIHNMKNADIDYRKHFTLTDREVTYPTGTGLALHLRSLGTAAFRVKLDGKVDIPAIIKDPKNTNFRFQLIPSAAINLGSEIVIDGVAVETGLRMDLNIHTSTGSDVTFRVLDGHGVDVKIGLPLPKQEIISIKTEYNSIVRDQNHVLTATPVKYETPRENYEGCFDQLDVLLGLTFCGEISVPYEQGKPIFPLYGPVNLQVRVDKEDGSLTSYHFKAHHIRNEEINGHGFELLYDTPNSKVPRKLNFILEGSPGPKKRFLRVGVVSPWTTADLNAHIVDDDEEMSFNIKFDHGGDEYSARIGAKGVDLGKDKFKVTPIFEYKAPEAAKSALIGKKGSQKQKSQAISASGSLTAERVPNKYAKYTFHSLALATPRTTYILDGNVIIEPSAINGDMKVSYDKEHVTIKGKAHHSNKELAGHLDIAPSQYPDLGVSASIDSKFDQAAGNYENKLILVHGPDPKSQTSRIYIHNKFDRKPGDIVKFGPLEFNTFSTVHEITYPVVQLDAGVKAGFSQKEVFGGIRGKFDKYSAKLEGAVQRGEKAEGDYQASLDGEFMGQELKLQSSRSVEGPYKSRFTNLLIAKPGGTYQANALVNHKVTENEIDLSIVADASVPSKAAIKLSGGLEHSDKICRSNLKLYLGDKCFIDGHASLNYGNTPKGDFKLSLPGYLESSGKLTSDGSYGTAVADLHLPKADRKMEAKADFTVKAPKYSGSVSVCYDTKDPKKTFKIETNNEFHYSETAASLDTKNTLSHGDTVAHVNAKGKSQGEVLNNAASAEVEVILPNGYNLGGKYNEKYNFKTGQDLESNFVLWDQPKGQEKQKLEFNMAAKHVDPRQRTIDGQASFSYVGRDKRDVHAHVNAKKVLTAGGKSSNIAFEVGSSGSLLDLPSTFKFESEVSNEYLDVDVLDESVSIEYFTPPITFKFSGNAGQEIKIDGTGKIDKPSTLELSGTLPHDSGVKNFKISSSNLIDVSGGDHKLKAKVKFINSVHYNDNKYVKLLLEAEQEGFGVQYAAEYETNLVPKKRLSGSAHFSDENSYKGDASVALILAPDNQVQLSVKGEANMDGTDSNIHILGKADQYANGAQVDIQIKNKIIKEGKGLHSEIVATQGAEKKVAANARVELDKDHPIFEVNLDRPEGKSRFFYKYDKKGDRHYTSELKAKWTGKNAGTLSADNEINLASVDNFLFKGTLESAELIDAGKLHVEIANKPAKGEAKKITFLLKEGDKVVASGSSNYNYKEEGDVAVLEGSGNIKYKDQSYPLNFQAVSKAIEDGIEAKVDIKAGKRTFNLEHKATSDEFSIVRTYCIDPKACSKSQISSKVKTSLEHDEQSTIVLLDLSLFNPKLHDISYKSEYKRNNFFVDYNSELQWASDAKLQSKAYIHENSAGLYLTLPKRTIGGEVKYDVKKKGNTGGSVRFETEVHTNKGKEPKLSFIAGTTTQYDKGVLTMAGEVKAIHPALQKDLYAKGQISISDKPAKLVEGLLEIDVSPDSNNKLIGKLKTSGNKELLHTVASLKSKGCNIDITYEEKIKVVLNGKDSTFLHSEGVSYVDSKNQKKELLGKFEASLKRVYGVLKAPEALVEVEFLTDKGYSGSLNIFGKKYKDSLTYNKEKAVATYKLTGLADGKSLTVEAGGRIGGSGVLSASIGDKKACSLDVSLDEANFLKSKYNYDPEILKSIYAALTKEVNILVKDGTKSVQSIYEKQLAEGKRLFECLSKSKPNIGAFVKYYEEQFKKIREEIESDKSFKEASETLKDVAGDLGQQVAVILEEAVKLLKTFGKLAEEAGQVLKSAWEEIQPKLKSSFNKLSKVFNDLFEQYLKLSVDLVNLALDELKKHQEDFDVFAQTAADFIADVGKQIGQLVIAINKQIDDLVEHNIESLSDLPIVTAVQEKWQELKDFTVPVEVFNLIHELLESFKALLPTKEATQFVTTLESVLQKILNHEEIKNKDEVMKQLYKEFVAAIKSLYALLAEQAPQTGLLKPTKLQSLPLINLFKIPTGTIKFSLFSLLASSEYLPSFPEILSGLRLSWNPLDNIPPFRSHAIILGGTDVITFDGQYLSIPASCSYILAEDYKDRNFSIVGQISEGALKSLTFSSKEDIVEIRPNGNVLVNGKEHGLPFIKGDLRVWRRPAVYGIYSKAGVMIFCSPELDICSVDVNGFYFGRTRGLLGNMNGEKYDDRLIPDGKIVSETSDLASAWKLDPSCSIPSTAGHKHNRVSQCTSLFSDEPVALLCRPFVNPAPYRMACDHLAAKSKTEGACLAVKAYTAACFEFLPFVEVPDECATCKINGKEISAGESEDVNQGTSADVVVLVDQSKDNEANFKQIAVPLVSELKSELGKAGVSDVKVLLVGASPTDRWPSFYTNKAGELTFDPSSISFVERPVSNETLADTIQGALNEWSHTYSIKKMYSDVSEQPFLFRPNSYRFLLGVHGSPCRPNFGNILTAIVRIIDFDVHAIKYSVIVPTAGNVSKGREEFDNACVIQENSAFLSGGEKVEKTEYDGHDLCAYAAIDQNGVALSAEEVKASPQRAKLINNAAAAMVKSAVSEKQELECECELFMGILPHPVCTTS